MEEDVNESYLGAEKPGPDSVSISIGSCVKHSAADKIISSKLHSRDDPSPAK